MVAIFSTGCLDNPACIFGGDCSTTATVGVGANSATFPVSGQWIQSAAPSVDRVFPSGNMAQPNTPIVLVFSESMNEESMIGAFTLMDMNSGIPVPTPTFALVGDGRVLVLFPGAGGFSGMEPPTPLQAGSSYELRLTDEAEVFDLTGQSFTDGDGLLGSFTVASTPSEIPAVLTTWPLAGVPDASSVTEFVVIFDQAVDPTTVTANSMSIRVDGIPPQLPPVAFDQLMISGGFGPSTPEPRVWTHRVQDANGDPIPLLTHADVMGGALGEVEIRISPASDPIASLNMMQEVAPTPVMFTLSQLFAPVMASLMSTPIDAIGIRNLVDPMGGDGDLALDVILEEGLLNDVLEVWLFGVVRDADDLPQNVAFVREIQLDADMNTVTLTELELDLATTTDPLATIVDDGDLGMAFRIRRGLESTPVFVMDVDSVAAGVQDIILDITPPELVGYGPLADSTVEFRSDQRHMTLFGTASEELRECDVALTIGASVFDNGTDTPVLSSDANGVFLAAPVTLPGTGVVDPLAATPTFTATLRDRAFNTTAVPLVGNFVQVGSVAPGVLVAPSGTIQVEVIDARTLAPLENAFVSTHQEDMGVITTVSTAVTTADGLALVGAAATGDTILTIDAVDHDLFTFHGVTTNRISIPLEPSEELILVQSSIGVSTTPGVFSALTSFATDTRVDPANAQRAPMDLCFTGPDGLEACAGSPFIRRGMVGSVSLVGGVFPSGIGTYSAQSFLRAFSFAVARPVVNTFGSDVVNLPIDRFLDDPGVPDEELSIDWTPHPTVTTVATTGINLGLLAENPSVLVQANVPGQPGSLSVGMGVTFDNMAGGFDLRAAYPGVVDTVQDSMADELGIHVSRGLIESDLRLRVELTEQPLPGTFLSNRAGARPKLSSAPAMIFPLGVPTILSPMPLQMTGVSGFDVVFDGVIFDQIVALGKRGLYKVTLTSQEDPNNANRSRKWVLYRPDQNNLQGQPVSVHVPDISPLGGSSFPAGAITASVSAFAWEDYDAQDFLWTDVEREYDLFSHTLPTVFNNTP